MATTDTDLEPIEPSTARDLFIDQKATDCTEATVRNHSYRLKYLFQWCAEGSIDNLNDLTGLDLQWFRLWRREEYDLEATTLRNQMSGLRVFLKWAASIDAVDPELYDKVLVPKISREERKRDTMLDVEDAKAILDHLTKYQFASRNHVLLALLWDTGIRIGSANSIDLQDVHLQDEFNDLVHRSDAGTTLKNGKT